MGFALDLGKLMKQAGLASARPAAVSSDPAPPANPANWLIQASEISQLATLAGVATHDDASPRPLERPRSDANGARPYRLTPAQADRAHAVPWDDEACSVFITRVTLFIRKGLDVGDADDLAERLCLRDLDADNRALCLECTGLVGTASTGWRCCRPRAAGVAAALPAELVTQLQRCPAFRSAT